MTSPRAVRIEDPEKDLVELFGELVGGRARRSEPTRVGRLLESTFKRLQGRPGVFVRPKYTIPIIDREVHVPYAYQNGAYNLIKPEAFVDLERSAVSAGLRLAAEGELIRSSAASPVNRAKLIVVSSGDPTPSSPEIDERLGQLFRAFDVEFVPRTDVEGFLTRVETDVNSHG